MVNVYTTAGVCSHDIGNINIKIPCYIDKHEKAPIHLAAENGHVETVLALLDQFSAEVNLKDSEGNTPLHCCVLNPYDPHRMRDKDHFNETARVLIKFCVAINEKNLYGDTALHLAAMNHFQRIVELLLEVGANPFVENNEHLKPLDVVPDSDPVTKQVLKMAMLQPRPTGDSISMASDTMRKELGDFTPNQTPTVVKKPQVEGAVNRSNDSSTESGGAVTKPAERNSAISTNSVGSSVFEDMKPPNIPLPPAPPTPTQLGLNESGSKTMTSTPATPGSKHKAEGGTETMYTKVDKKAKRAAKQKKALERMLGEKSKSTKQGQFQFDADDTLSTLGDTSISSIATEDAVAMTMNNELENVFRRRQQQQPETTAPVGGATEPAFATEEQYMDMASSPPPQSGKSKKQKKKKKKSVDAPPSAVETASGDKQAIYANFEQIEALRKERQAAAEKAASGEAQPGRIIQVQSVEDLGKEGDIQVHTIPGKPGLIEVQYMGGPITISVNTQDQQGAPGAVGDTEEGERGPVSKEQQTEPSGQESGQVGTGQQQVTMNGQLVGQSTGQLVLGPLGQQKPIVGMTTHGDPIHLLPGQMVGGQASYIVQGQVGHIVQGQFIPYPADVQAYLLQQHQLMATLPLGVAQEGVPPGQNTGLNQSSSGSLSNTQVFPSNKQDTQGQSAATTQGQPGQPEDMDLETGGDTKLSEQLKQQQLLYEQRLQEQQRQIEQQQLLLLQQKENQELLQQQQKQQEEYVQLIEKQQQLLQEQQKQELLQQKMQVHKGQQRRQTQEQKMNEEEQQQKQGSPQQKVKVKDVQEKKLKQDLLQQKMQVHDQQQEQNQKPPNAMYYLRSDGSLNEDEEYEVSPDVSPNASPQYKNFQQAMAWAKSLDNKTVSPGRVTVLSEHPPQSKGKSTQFETPGKQGGILATPERGHWKVAPGSAMTVVEATGEDDDTGEMKDTDFKKALQHPQNKHDDFYSITTHNVQAPPGEDSSRWEATRSTGIQDVVTEYGQEPGVLQKCTLSAPATDSDLSPTSPTNLSERSNSPQSIYSEGGTQYSGGLNMRVTGQAPKAYSRATTSSARKAFMMAKPIGIESGSEASDTELGGSRSSLSTGRQWEPTQPVYGKGGPEGLVGRKSGKEPGLGETEAPKPESDEKKSKGGYKMIGSYAKPYKSFGQIETKTDVIDKIMAEQREADEALDEVFQANLRHSQEFDRDMVLSAIAGTTDAEKKPTSAQHPLGTGTQEEPKYYMIPEEETNLPDDEDTEAGERMRLQSPSQATQVAAPVSASSKSPSSPPTSPKTVTFVDQPQDDVTMVTTTTVVTTVTSGGLPTQMTMADIVVTGENDDDEDESLEMYADEPHMIKPRKVVGTPTALAAVTKQELGKRGAESPSGGQQGSPAPGHRDVSQQPSGGEIVARSQEGPGQAADQQHWQQQQREETGLPASQQGHIPAQQQMGVIQQATQQYSNQQLTAEEQQLQQQQQQQQGTWSQYAGTEDPMFAMQQQLINQQQQHREPQLQNIPQQQQQQQQNREQQLQNISQQQQQPQQQLEPQQQAAVEDAEVAQISEAAAKKKKGKKKKSGKKKKKGDKAVALESVEPPQDTLGQQPQGALGQQPQAGEPTLQQGMEPLHLQQGSEQYQPGQEQRYEEGTGPQYQQGRYQQGQKPSHEQVQYEDGQQPQNQQGQQPKYQQGQYQQGQEPQYQQGQEPQYQQGQYQQGQEPQNQQGQYQQGQAPQYQQGQYQQGQEPQYQQGQYQQGQEPQYQQGQYLQGQEPQYQLGHQQGEQPQYQQGQYQQGQPQYQQQGQEPQYQQQGQEPQYQQQGQEPQYQQQGQEPQYQQQGQEPQYQPGEELQYQQEQELRYQQGPDAQLPPPELGSDLRPQTGDQDTSLDTQSPVLTGHDQSFDSQNKAKKKGGFWSFPSGRRKKGKGSTSELPKSQSHDGSFGEASQPTPEGERGEGQEEVKRKGSFFNLSSMRSKKKGKKSKQGETYGATPYIEGEGEGQVRLTPELQHAQWSPSVPGSGQQFARETDIDADLEVQPKQPYQQQQQPYQQPQQPYQQQQQPYQQQQQPYEQQQQPYEQQQQPYEQQQQPYEQQQQPYEQQQPQQPYEQPQQQQVGQQRGHSPAGPLGMMYPDDAQEVTQQYLQHSPGGRRARKPKPGGAAIAIEPVVVPASFEDAAMASITANLQNRPTDSATSEEPIPQEPMSRMWKGQGERDAEMQRVLESTQRDEDVTLGDDLNQEPLPPDSDARVSGSGDVKLRRPVGGKPAWERRADGKRRSFRESETGKVISCVFRSHFTFLCSPSPSFYLSVSPSFTPALSISVALSGSLSLLIHHSLPVSRSL